MDPPPSLPCEPCVCMYGWVGWYSGGRFDGQGVWGRGGGIQGYIWIWVWVEGWMKGMAGWMDEGRREGGGYILDRDGWGDG